MLKKGLTILCTLLLCVCALSMSAFAATTASGTCGSNVSWVLTDDGTLTISGEGEPVYYNTRPPWYEWRGSIKKVVVEEGITSIPHNAFYEDYSSGTDTGTVYPITSVTLPSTVTRIEQYAFAKCFSLNSIKFPVALTYIGEKAFATTNQQMTFTFAGDAPEMHESAFYSLRATWYYPKGNETWTEDVRLSLYGASSSGESYKTGPVSKWIRSDGVIEGLCGGDTYWELKSGTLTIKGTGSTGDYRVVTATIYTLPNYYRYRHLIDKIEAADGITRVGNDMFALNFSSVLDVVLADSVTEIGNRTFSGITSFIDVTWSKNLEVIGNNAFYGQKMRVITFPETLTSIGSQAFGGCSNLTSITFTGPAPEIAEDAFYNVASATATYSTAKGGWTADKLVNYGAAELIWNDPNLVYLNDVTVTNNSAAVITVPSMGWIEGSNTFKVSCASPCVVALKNGDGGYTKLDASEGNGEYTFTAALTEGAEIAVVTAGDANGDKAIDDADSSYLKTTYLKTQTLPALQMLAADVNGDGKISNADVTYMIAVRAGLTTYNW